MKEVQYSFINETGKKVEIDERDLLLRLIVALVVCGVEHGKESSRTERTQELLFLMKVWDRSQSLQSGLPDELPDAEAGMAIHFQAIWIRRPAKRHSTFSKNELNLFYDGKTLVKNRLRPAWLAIASSPSGQTAKSTEILAEINDTLESIGIPCAIDTDYPSDRVLICGVDKGTVWIGYRDSIDAAKAALERNGARRARMLQEAPGNLNVTAFAGPTDVLPWLHVNRTAINSDDRFASVCRSLLHPVTGLQPTPTCDYDTISDSSHGPGLVTYLETSTVGAANDVLTTARPMLAKHELDTLIICMPASCDDAVQLLSDPDVVRYGYAKRRIVVFGFEHAAAGLSRAPWVWSKYFGEKCGIAIIRNDPQRLRTELLGANYSATDDLVHNEKTTGVSLTPGGRYSILGPSGSGKTIALFQVLQQQSPDQFTIVVRSTCAVPDIELAIQIVAEVAPEAFAIVVDDMDEQSDAVRDNIHQLLREHPNGTLFTSSRAPLPFPLGNRAVAIALTPWSYPFLANLFLQYLGEPFIPAATQEFGATCEAVIAGNLSLNGFVEHAKTRRAQSAPKLPDAMAATQRVQALAEGRAPAGYLSGEVPMQDLLTAMGLADYDAHEQAFIARYEALSGPNRLSARRFLLLIAGLSCVKWSISAAFARECFAHLQLSYTTNRADCDAIIDALRDDGWLGKVPSIVSTVAPGWGALAKNVDALRWERIADAVIATTGHAPERLAILRGLVVHGAGTGHEYAGRCALSILHDYPHQPVSERANDIGQFLQVRLRHREQDRFIPDILSLLPARDDQVGLLSDVVQLFDPEQPTDTRGYSDVADWHATMPVLFGAKGVSVAVGLDTVAYLIESEETSRARALLDIVRSRTNTREDKATVKKLAGSLDDSISRPAGHRERPRIDHEWTVPLADNFRISCKWSEGTRGIQCELVDEAGTSRLRRTVLMRGNGARTAFDNTDAPDTIKQEFLQHVARQSNDPSQQEGTKL